jgi:hypothetical protein
MHVVSAVTDLVQRLSTSKNEVLGTDDETVLEEVTSSVVIECVLVTIECASVEGVEITCGSQCNCLLLHSTVGCWRRVLSSRRNQQVTVTKELKQPEERGMKMSVKVGYNCSTSKLMSYAEK